MNKKSKDKTLEDFLLHLGRFLLDKKADRVTALDVSSYSSAFEGLIIATAHSVRHARSLADNLLEEIKKQNLDYLGMEGYQEGEWILLDINEIIVHIFTAETRQFYNLEGFWTKGKEILLKAAGENND
ncbi:MAG: ribosome silencing factor [Desulfonatronovibrionaceae bacterium]